MEKKRSIGVTIFGISLLYFPLMQVIKFIKVCQYSSKLQGILVKPSFSKIAYKSPLMTLLFFVIVSVLVFGILSFKKWAYYMLIVIASLAVIQNVYDLFIKLNYIRNGVRVKPTLLIEAAILLIYFATMIYYFTRSKVKEQFN